MLKTKIALACTVLILFSTLTTQFIYHAYNAEKARQTAIESGNDATRLLSQFLDSRLRGVGLGVFSMMTSDAFLFGETSHFVSYMDKGNPNDYAAADYQASKHLNTLRLGNDFIFSAFLQTPRGLFVDNSRTKDRGFDFESSQLKKTLEQFNHQPGFLWGDTQMEEGYRYPSTTIPLVFNYIPRLYGQPLYLVVNLSISKILSYTREMAAFTDGNVLIFNSATGNMLLSINRLGTEVFTEDSDMLKARPETITIDDEIYHIFFADSAYSPWLIVTLRSQDAMFSGLTTATRFAVLVALAGALLSIFFAISITNSLTKPLTKFEKAMQSVGPGHYDTRFDYRRNDEIGSLSGKFNHMMEQLSSTIEALEDEKELVKAEQIKKRKAELTALQAQINPHFLYNTLNSIVWMAQKHGVSEIGQMSKALGSFFELSLNDGKKWIRLTDELKQVESYLAIQTFRYGEKLTYHVSMADDLRDTMVLKLILQPLVENAIYHGIKEKEGNGFLSVMVSRHHNNQDMVLTVADDGPGMPIERLEKINAHLKAGSRSGEDGYGIYNINERIRLTYGPPFGLQYTISPSGGLIAEIVIPILTLSEVAEDV